MGTYRCVIIVLIFALTAPLPSFCGLPKANIDSMLTVLKEMSKDRSRVDMLNEISRSFSIEEKFSIGRRYADEAYNLAIQLKYKKGEGDALNNIGNTFPTSDERALKYYRAALALRMQISDREGIAGSHNNIGKYYLDKGDYKKALVHLETAVQIRTETGEKAKAANSLISLGGVYGYMGNSTAAMLSLIKAKDIFMELKDSLRLAKVQYNIGCEYVSQGDHPEALKTFYECLKINEQLGQVRSVANVYMNIATIRHKTGNYTDAIQNYKRALKIFEELGDQTGIADVHLNMATTYFRKNDHKVALELNEKSVEIYKRLGNQGELALAIQNKASILRMQKNYEESLKLFQEALNLSKENGQEKETGRIWMNISTLYIDQGKYLQARESAEKALTILKDLNDPDLLGSTYFNLSKIDSGLGNYKSALEEYKIAMLLQDSVFNSSKQIEINRLTMRYDFQKREDSLNYIQRLTTEKLQRQTMQRNSLAVGILVIATIFLLAYNNYRTRQQLKLQTLRNKIAADLHDDVGSTLSSISIFSQVAQEESKEVIPALETIGESSRKMLDAMADIVWTINPENDQFDKIVLRMRSFAYELLGAKHIEFRFVADGEVGELKLSMDARKNLFLIFKEATNNMVKYSEADKAMFSLKTEKNKLVMMIRDNGKGFDTSLEVLGNGLKNMKKRAKEIGGELVIDSAPGEGTTIMLEYAVTGRGRILKEFSNS